ncbi:MAG: hypothetical protein ACYTJ0_13610 [Planctomycetota bacterium]|jgi:hypothetical protein
MCSVVATVVSVLLASSSWISRICSRTRWLRPSVRTSSSIVSSSALRIWTRLFSPLSTSNSSRSTSPRRSRTSRSRVAALRALTMTNRRITAPKPQQMQSRKDMLKSWIFLRRAIEVSSPG